MAQTRAQGKRDNTKHTSAQPEKATGESLSKSGVQKRGRKEDEKVRKNKSKIQVDNAPTSKKAKTAKDKPETQERQHEPRKLDKSKLEAMLKKYGTLPLQDSGLVSVDKPEPKTILALVYLAMLTSARISHELAYRSVTYLLEAGYHDHEKLKQSTWEERTEVLTKGGYTRYREKTATGLGELAEFVDTRYGGDLNNLLKRADSSLAKVRNLLQEIKGIGKVGVDIFFDSAQGVWPSLAPFIDPRSKDTAKICGLGSNVEEMWEAVDKDPVEMCKLSSALTMIRLDKKEGEFK